MKEIIGDKRVTNVPLSNDVKVKSRQIFDKKNLRKRLIINLLISVPT